MGIKELWIKMKYPHWVSSSQRHNRKEELELIEVEASSDDIDKLYNEGLITKEEREEFKANLRQ